MLKMPFLLAFSLKLDSDITIQYPFLGGGTTGEGGNYKKDLCKNKFSITISKKLVLFKNILLITQSSILNQINPRM